MTITIDLTYPIAAAIAAAVIIGLFSVMHKRKARGENMATGWIFSFLMLAAFYGLLEAIRRIVEAVANSLG